MEILKPEEIVELFKEKFGDSITESTIETKIEGMKKNSYSSVWLTLKLNHIKEAVRLLSTIQFPHFCNHFRK